ncbi:molybdopterin-dependent oxidoreductase [Acidobacteria bacterium AH-259-O06]|nr:molybdopterin-dependent oxidoreductase [Acidobacteria bacterium AH-259-O06]
MPIITVNGQEVHVEPQFTVIQAAEKLGIYVPRYCYHPGLSIAGSCRMCLVEIENMFKLAISCYTRVRDGMTVTTDSKRVTQARKAMLEFLLINHPLDCPVCDQSGECDLQNYYMEIGQYDSRFLENKIKRKKAFPVGPHVVLDQERCILCTRCTRFCEEVSRSHELGVFNRGNRSVIDLHPAKTLDNPYSGNVIDICPVGALTEREFRFKCRVWYLSTRDSICSGCARGCNISIHYNESRPYKAGGRRAQRLKPRFNPLVNQWWMCDEGRFGYEFIDKNRIEQPYLRAIAELELSEWDKVIDEVSTALKSAWQKFGPNSIGVIASPQLSNEELYLIQKLFAELMGIEQIGYRNPWEKGGFQDDFLIRADKNPNSRGAEEIGLSGDVRTILEKAACGEIKILYIFQHNFDSEEARKMLEQAEYIVFQGTNWNKTADFANVILPGATYAEKDGTFTNFEGRVQRFQQAFLPLSEAKADSEILTVLAEKLEYPLVYLTAEDIFMEWYGKPYEGLEEFGEMISQKKHQWTI